MQTQRKVESDRGREIEQPSWLGIGAALFFFVAVIAAVVYGSLP